MSSDDSHLSQISTLWSVVRQAHGDQTLDARSAQEELLRRYGGAIRRYLIAALRNEDAADDVYQEFSLKFVRGDFAGADPSKGRFRAFVKTCLFRMIVDHQRGDKRRRRVGALPEGHEVEDHHEDEADEAFTRSWREGLLARAWESLERHEKETSRPYHTVLRHRADHPAARSQEMAEALTTILGKEVNAAWVRQNLRRARDEFARRLLEEVGDSLATSSVEAIEEELGSLDLLEYCRPALEKLRGADEDGS